MSIRAMLIIAVNSALIAAPPTAKSIFCITSIRWLVDLIFAVLVCAASLSLSIHFILSSMSSSRCFSWAMFSVVLFCPSCSVCSVFMTSMLYLRCSCSMLSSPRSSFCSSWFSL